MTFGRGVRIALSAVIALLCTAAGAAAQTNDEIFPEFQWNFSTPGARANAMGRAFIGMADDATATISNPAGLVSLTKPQVYFEYKNTNLKIDRLAAIDAFTSKSPTTFATDINALSFFTISMPFKNRFAVGLTYDQFLNYQETFDLSARPIPSSTFILFPVHGSADFKGSEFGLTFSAAVSPKLNVGLTVGMNRLSSSSAATRFAFVEGANFLTNKNDLSTSTVINSQTSIDKSDSAASLGFGILARPSDKISIGFNYVMGPKFAVPEDFSSNPGSNALCAATQAVATANGLTTNCGTNQTLQRVTVPSGFATFPRTININVPDRIGVGVALRPQDRWLFAFDVVRINYSSLTDKFTLMFSDEVDVQTANPSVECGAATACTAKSFLTGSEYKIANATEIHAGAEYNLITGSNPVFIRAGVFTNPDHRVSYTNFASSSVPATAVTSINLEEQATYNLLERKGDVRGTIGAGIALGQQMQVDLAYVIGKEFVASTAIRFK